MSKTNWDDFAPVDPAVKPAKPTNWSEFAPVEKSGAARKLADTGLALGQGVVQGAQMLTNIAGADNAVSRTLGTAAQKLASVESPERRAEKQARAQKVDAAEKSGSLFNEISANLGGFAEAPIDTTVNALGTSLPTLAAAALTGGGSVAAQLGARFLPGLIGGAQGVGAVKGAIYDTVKNKLTGQGMTEAEADARASEAQAYGGDNAAQLALGGGLGVLAGSTGIERAATRLMGKAAVPGREDTVATTMDLAKAAGVGALKEAPIEGLQGGQERVASNIALQNEGFDTPTFEGAVGQGVLEATASAPLGGGFGVADRLARNPGAPAPAAPGVPPAPPVQPESSNSAGPADLAPFVNPPSLTGGDAAAMLAGQMGGFERNTDPLRAVVKPSEAMGIDPSAGPLSRVAAAAVDSGVTDQTAMDEARAAAIQTAPSDQAPEQDADAPMLAAIESYNEDMQGMASPSMVSSRFGITVERAAELLAKIKANPTPSADELFPLPAADAPQDQALTGGASEVAAQGKPVAPAAPEVADAATTAPTNLAEYEAEVRRQLGDLKEGDTLTNDMGDVFTVDAVMRNKAGEIVGVLPRERDGEGDGSGAVLNIQMLGGLLLPTPYTDTSGNRKMSGAGKVTRKAANVQDPAPAAQPEAAAPETPAVEAPAPAGGDGAATAGVPDAGRADAAAPAVATPASADKRPAEPASAPQDRQAPTAITKAELDKLQVSEMSDAQLRAGDKAYGAVHKRAIKMRKEIARREEIQKQGLDKSPAPQPQEPSNETQQEADARPNVPDEARQEADEEGVLSDGAQTTQAVETEAQGRPEAATLLPDQVGADQAPATPAPAPAPSAPERPNALADARAARKEQWLKNVASQQRIVAVGGATITGHANGRVTFAGDPSTSKAGRALRDTVAEAMKAGATAQEVAEAALGKPAAAPDTDKPNGRLQAERDANPVILFGRAMNDAGLEFDGNDPRAWSAKVGKKGEVHARMEERANAATLYRVYSFFDGKDTGDSISTISLADAAATVQEQRADLLAREQEAAPAPDANPGDALQARMRADIAEQREAEAAGAAAYQANADRMPPEEMQKPSLRAKWLQGYDNAEPAPAPKPAPVVSANTIFTEDAAEKARARLKAKLGRLNSGVDPEMLMDGITLAGYHIEKGARTFAAFARAMVDDLGDGVKPFLKSWYMGVKYDPRAAVFDGMDGAGAVEGADVDALTAAAPEPKARTLTESLYNAITAGNMPKDNPGLKKLVEAFDGQPADQSRMKQAQEELETAIVMVSRNVVARGEGDRSTFDILLRLYESQPNLNIRTSTSIANQAYSTPSPLAFLASRLAGITRKTVAHEPTAGTGMLLIGADQKKAIVNELNDVRITALKSQGFAPTQKDAATQALVPADTQPDAVVTNPPFGSVKDADGKPVKVKVDGYNIGQIDHLIAARALNTMKEDGRATLILGANKAAGGLSTDDRIFFNWLYSHYNVVGHFEVEGDLYNRQGAGWPVRVITINGRQKSSKISPIAGTIQRVDNWSQVYEQFTQSLQAAEAPRVAPDAEGGRAPATGAAPVSIGAGRPAGGARGAGNVAGASPRVVPDRAEPAAEPVAPSPDEQRLNAQSNVPQPQPGQGNAERTRPAKPAGDAAVTAEPAQGNEFQVPYAPRSARKDEGVLIPANMAQPTQDALSRLEDEVGDIDEFARVELGYDSVEQLHNALMGLQVDSVATAIYQIKQGKGVVIADQTGIGKGRQAASIIRWAARQGMTPVFVSVKPSLFTDMYGDLADIGTNDIQPFIMNSDAWVAGEGGAKLFANRPAGHKSVIQGIADSGQLPEGSNALFMTYSQINVANVQRQALMALAPNAVFVLDESHNAAGASQTGQFMIDTLGMAKGVTYLSATYAKRPDNMPLYFKTDIGEAAADTDGLAVAMASGGLPLQTVVSNNLVKAGQMFRRERSYDGVSIASVFDTPSRALHERMSNEATKALRAIVAADRMFHGVFVKQLADQLAESGATVKDSAGNQLEAGVQHTEFSSVVHNFVKQMLLGLKAQSAANEAIASLKRGEKPIIAVENTMGSFLNEYAASNGIGQGDSLGSFDYRTVLTRALMRSRVIIEVAPSGDKVKRQVSLDELDAQTRAEYEAAQKVIDGLTLDIPVSPIDWMRAEIQRAGFSVAEITGRNLSVDYSNPKKPILSAIDAAEQKDKVNTTRRFNSGGLDSLILNVAGSTGISLHASEKFEDQRQRHMIVAQAAGDINIFMQMLGRVHRTGQVRLPKYTILSVDLPTEKRPTAVLSIKMKSLNANTSSNTESATSVKSSDILNKYGDQIVQQYLVDNYALARALDLEGEIGGDTTEDIARKATGRLALQPIATQNVFYDEVEAQYTALIDYLNKTNQNDLEPRTFDFDAKETRQEVLFDGPNKDTPFGEDAVYGEYSIKAQGTPMKPEEIRAAMGENLGELTPAAHSQQMLDDLDSKFNAYYAGLDDGSKDSASLTRSIGRSFISDHKIGSTFRVEINSEPFNAMVLNVRNAHKETGNPFSLSKIQLTVAVNGALRSLSVPATQFNKIEVSAVAPFFKIEALFKEQPPNQRETAKIVTGNLLAAYGELQGVRGTIITFTKQDGTSEQGILLPKLFDYSKNTRGDYRLVDGAAALKFLQESNNKDIGRFGIMSRDGNVRVLPSGQGVRVQVPKSKLKGGKYFLDKGLIDAGGDFVSSGSFMVSTVQTPADAVKMLDLLMKKQALYALPSMADEAKALVGSATPAADASFLRVDAADPAADTPADANTDTSAAAARNIGVLERAIARNSDGTRDAGEVRPYDARFLSGDAELREIAEAFGSRLQGFGLRPGLLKADADRFGFFNGVRTGGTVFIAAKGNTRPHLAILGHELGHELRTRRPDLYDRLVDAIRPYIDQKKYAAEFLNSAVAKNAGNKDKQREEFIGEVLSDGFMDRDFWRALGNKNPSLLRQIGGMLMNLVERVLAKAGYSKKTEQYLTDYKAVMTIAGEVMAEFGVQRGALGVTAFNAKAPAKNTIALPKNVAEEISGSITASWDDGSDLFQDLVDDQKTAGMAAADVRVALDSLAQRLSAHQGGPFVVSSFDYDVMSGELESIAEVLTDRAELEDEPEIKTMLRAVKKALREIDGVSFLVADGQNDTAFNVKDAASRSMAGIMNNVREATLPAGYIVNDFIQSSGKVPAWFKTVGTMYGLAQREPLFRPVFEAAQKFLSDVSFYATKAADMAPTILPKLETLRDITKSPLAAKDAKAIAAPIFEGTLTWARDPLTGKPISMEELEARAAKLTPTDKAQEMMRKRVLDPKINLMWQGLPEDQYNANINTRYANQMLKSGIVFTPAELKELFGLTGERNAATGKWSGQIGLYDEFRAATNKSITDMAIADIVRYGGKDLAPVADVVLEAKTLEEAAEIARNYLVSLAEQDPKRDKGLSKDAAKIVDKAASARDLMDRGYAPLSRFGKYSVDVVDKGGERLYFGLFESQSEANKMVRQMRDNYPDATIASGTMSAEAYKVFAGVTPETLELFGEMLGLEATGDEAKDKAFQEYLKLAKNQRSAMKRLIHRKGIAGFSEDPGRVLAGFIYSNSRQISSSLNLGNLKNSLQEIPKGQGELADVAGKMVDYVSNPVEEAQAIRGLLFAQYLGGSVASAMLNALQPVQVTIPWLSQYGGPVRAASRMSRAMRDVLASSNKPGGLAAALKKAGEEGLAAAITKAEEQGIVSPQEVFQLQAQAAGRASLSGGDGTRLGDATAAANNALSRVSLAWGKLFGAAEQFNRRTTFIAAYRTAQEQRINDPSKFAERAVNETQFIYNKGNKPQWARGAIGSTVFTFKQYSISYVELMQRMYSRGGPEGKRAALLGMGVLLLMSGVGGLPFIEDVEDVVDGFMQRVMNRNFSSKQAREQFFTDLLTEDGAALVMRGFSGLPGSPVDVSGRLGLGNLIPGTGIFQKKDDYGRDLLEIVGPAGDFGKRILEAAGKTAQGEILGQRGALMTLSPVAARNLGIAYDMANTGSYQDQRGRKVIDTTGSEAAFKAIGFQPSSVDKVQDASFREQRMTSLNKIRETEIADKWARGVYLQDQEVVQDARAELAQWNEDNPESPIRINLRQISQRVKYMRMDKIERLSKTAPKELRAAVRERLEASR